MHLYTSKLMYLHRFGNLLPFGSSQELDCLLEEFLDFKLLQRDHIPSSVWEMAAVTTHEDVQVTHHRMDIIWHHLSSLKSPDGTVRFKRLCQIAKLVLVLPHSNAQEERVYSMEKKKNKTLFRPSLDPKGTLL